MPNPANPQDLNRYSYVRNNPIKYSDPSGNEVCYTDGRGCYEAADGEDSAQTRGEDAATVKILLDVSDSEGNFALTNVRYSEFGGLSGAAIIASLRGGADPGARTGADRRQFIVGQLRLDRDDARIDVGNLTWVAVANEVNKVAPTVGFVASGVCLVGGPTNPVGGVGCGVAFIADAAVVVSNAAAARTCDSPGCASDYLWTAGLAGTGAAIGRNPTDIRRAAALVWDGLTTGGSYQDRFVGDG